MPRRNDFHASHENYGEHASYRDDRRHAPPYRDDGRRHGFGSRNETARVARKGDRLQIHYTCFDENGKKLESTHDGGPAPTITLGGG
ncbi:MAG: hypothetical protein J5743_05545, partial [Victivallales bacterium]|nr:hypothetical protein [Victivallales bacterium]